MSASRLVPAVGLAVVALAAVALGGLGVYLDVAPPEYLGYPDWFVLALAAALGDRLELPRQHGRATTMSIAVVAAVALLAQHPGPVLAMAVAAWVAHTVRSVRSGQQTRVKGLLVNGVTAWGIGGIVALASSEGGAWVVGYSELQVLPVAVVWALLLVVAPTIEALEVATFAPRARRLRLQDLVRGGLSANSVLAATATLGALAYPTLGWGTVLLMALPMLAAKLGFDRQAETRTTYDQTLRAMSRLPEELGAVDPGHGVRAGELAALAAVELGYGVDVVTSIERAAQLHELGRIRTEHGLDLTPEEVARSGHDILMETEDLEEVARLIAAHRNAVAVGDELAWVGGALVRLACELDLRLTARGERVTSAADAAWIRSQGVQPRLAEAVVNAAEVVYPPVPTV